MFSVDTTPEKFAYPSITVHFEFMREENLGRRGKSHDYSDVIVSIISVFKFPRVEERFQKALFSRRIILVCTADLTAALSSVGGD